MGILCPLNVYGDTTICDFVRENVQERVSVRTAKNRSLAVCHPYKIDRLSFERLGLSVQPKNLHPFERLLSYVWKQYSSVQRAEVTVENPRLAVSPFKIYISPCEDTLSFWNTPFLFSHSSKTPKPKWLFQDKSAKTNPLVSQLTTGKKR